MQTNPLDYTKIATTLSLRAIERVITVGGTIFHQYWQNYKARDAATYAEYLVRKGVLSNSIRNFIYSDRSHRYMIYMFLPLSPQSLNIDPKTTRETHC
jgi:hypothetical protein